MGAPYTGPGLALALLFAAGCAAGSGPTSDGGVGDGGVAFPCGDMECAPSQICALPAIPADGGPAPACSELPAPCGGAPTCLCLRTACARIEGVACQSGFAVGFVYCYR